jgi:polyisoprenoid-binding protein YceI
MTTPDLRDRLASPRPPLLVHVLPEEIYSARRLPGSVNACVYEMAFLTQIAELSPDRDADIVVYGAGAGSLDAQTALEKLSAAGYTRVTAYPGGLAEWEATGLPVEGDGKLPADPAPHGDFRIDVAESVVRWTGRNLFNHHHGTVRLSGGDLTVHDGRLVAARFVVDLTTIQCEDLPDPQINALLIRHLHDADFFDVARHPVAEFIAEEAVPVPDCPGGLPNYQLRGRFTLRGVTRPLEFPAVIAAASPDRLTGQAQFEIDRTEFGSLYGSARYFRFLSKHVVNDHIHLHVKLHADRV